MEYIVQSNGRTVGKGFYGEDPDRFWVDADSDDAKTFRTRNDAVSFVHRTGDHSWNWSVEERPENDAERAVMVVERSINTMAGGTLQPIVRDALANLIVAELKAQDLLQIRS